MQTIELNSYFHYQTVDRGGRITLLEFPDDACPLMQQRSDFTPDEGKAIASWQRGELVRFTYGEGHEAGVGTVDALESVQCGDDFRYFIKAP